MQKVTTKHGADGARGDGQENHPVLRPEPPALNSFELGARLIAPWSNAKRLDVRRYPGRIEILRQIFDSRAAFESIQSWRKGHRNPPQWARDMLASYLERDGLARLAAARAIRQKEKGAD